MWGQDADQADGLASYADPWDVSRLPQLAAILPYDIYDPTTQLFELPNGSRAPALGFMLEGLPQVGISEQMEASMHDMLITLPEGSCLQVTMYADPDVRSQLAHYGRHRAGPDQERGRSIYRHMARQRFNHLTSLADELKPCDHRLFFSLITAGASGVPGDEKRIDDIRQAMEVMLDGCAIPTRRLAPIDIVQLIGGLLNPRHPSRRQMQYEPDEPIGHQCLLRDTAIEVGPHSLRVRGDGGAHALTALTVSRYPAAMRLIGMHGLLGDPIRANLRYLGPFMITMCMHKIDQEAARNLVAVKGARATSNANSLMARLMPAFYRRQLEDWQVCGEVVDGGGGMIQLSHHVLVQSTLAETAAAEERARSVWRARGFTLAKCEYLQLQGLLATLPLTLTPSCANDLRALGWMTLKTSYNGAHGMPVIAEWKGTRNPTQLFIGRRGQLMNLDIFDSNGNYNVIVAGASGTGKSVLLNEIAASSLGLGAKVWIFDIGCSYQRTNEVLGGQFLRFDPHSAMSLNPFSAVVDINEDMRLLKPMFAQMIAPQGGLSDFQRAHLERALLATWEAQGPAATPTDLQARLMNTKSGDPRIKDMAVMLEPFTITGVYGRWFDGAATVEFDADLMVIELEELKGNPELQAVIMMQLLFLVTQQMYANHSRRKLVLIDEAWELMRGASIAEFIEHGYRRARKYHGAFVAATQSVADFFASAAGRNVYANSDWMMLLAQKEEEVRQLVEHGQLAISAAEHELLRSLHTQPGRYSEVFIRCEGLASGIGRLVMDAHTELLFSTKAADRLAIDSYREQGLDLVQSIQAILDERAHVNSPA